MTAADLVALYRKEGWDDARLVEEIGAWGYELVQALLVQVPTGMRPFSEEWVEHMLDWKWDIDSIRFAAEHDPERREALRRIAAGDERYQAEEHARARVVCGEMGIAIEAPR